MQATIPLTETTYATLSTRTLRGTSDALVGDVAVSVWEIKGERHHAATTYTRDIAALVTAHPVYAEAVAEAGRKAAEANAQREQRQAENAAIRAEMLALRERAEREGTAGHFRYGKAPRSGHSRNARDNESEAGVSCYAGWLMPDGSVVLDQRGIDWVSGMFLTHRPLYRLYGDVVGTGADGEPCLAVRRSVKLVGDPVVSVVVA